jgi:hypothetical protein
MTQEAKSQTSTLACYNHPDRETMLRCNRCERPICTNCAVLTETGYRCKECVRSQQKVFDTAQTIDYPVAFIVACVLSYLGSYSTLLGFFVIFIAPVVGVVIAEAVRWSVHRRRSRALSQTALAGVIVGALPPLLIRLASMVIGGGMAFGLLSLLWPGVYLFLVASSMFYRFTGIRIR